MVGQRRRYAKTATLLACGLVTWFCISFVFFFRIFRGQPGRHPTLPESSLNKRIPDSRLIDASGEALDGAAVRTGKVLLVFVTSDCGFCFDEGRFLSTLVQKRGDVRFLGVNLFGENDEVIKSTAHDFPFKIYKDVTSNLRQALSIKEVPVKVYLEDGIIKKTWVGSTPHFKAEEEFEEWLKSLH